MDNAILFLLKKKQKHLVDPLPPLEVRPRGAGGWLRQVLSHWEGLLADQEQLEL